MPPSSKPCNCQKGLSILFTTAATLVDALVEAPDERSLLRLQKQIASYKLLIIEELGFVPLCRTGGRAAIRDDLPALRAGSHGLANRVLFIKSGAPIANHPRGTEALIIIDEAHFEAMTAGWSCHRRAGTDGTAAACDRPGGSPAALDRDVCPPLRRWPDERVSRQARHRCKL
jgi:hypothetical protein